MPEDEKPKVEVKVKFDEKKVKFEDKKDSKLTLPDSVSETVEDPYCDEKNPKIITFQDVCQAAFMIKGGIDVTPCRVSFKFYAQTSRKKMLTDDLIAAAISYFRSLWNGNLLEKGISSIYWKFQRTRCKKCFASSHTR